MRLWTWLQLHVESDSIGIRYILYRKSPKLLTLDQIVIVICSGKYFQMLDKKLAKTFCGQKCCRKFLSIFLNKNSSALNCEKSYDLTGFKCVINVIQSNRRKPLTDCSETSCSFLRRLLCLWGFPTHDRQRVELCDHVC